MEVFSPTVVDQTVLAEQVVFELGDADRFGLVPDQTVDLERDPLGLRADVRVEQIAHSASSRNVARWRCS
jgi:hypothetical protein